MKIYNYKIPMILCVIILLGALFWVSGVSVPVADEAQPVATQPRIKPDYCNTVIPPNIAPLNFQIQEQGDEYCVKIVSTTGEPIEIRNNEAKIQIPLDDWHALLQNNRGQQLRFEIAVKDENGWKQFEPVVNQIADDEIDPYLAYRILNPAYVWWKKMGIYQRNLETYEEKPILLNRATDGNCMNCHNFCNNNPDNMMLHMRGGDASGTMIARDGNILKVNTGTKFTKAGAYPAWHPGGKIIAYSVNQLEMFFHATGEPRDVLDRGSDLIVYRIDENIVTSHPSISSPERMENFPHWSPDGRYLYFCSSPKFDLFIDDETYHHDQILYDLMRIQYHPETGAWGELETVLASTETGLSMTIPRVSPDGKYLLFNTAKCGNFPIYMPDSDLWMMNLESREYHRLSVNSDQADTYHSWSSNSRWFVFSSKRGDGVCARPYLAYIDEEGKTYKPFVMPQKDPGFYDTFLKTYNVPELIKGPVKIRSQLIVKAAFDNEHKKNAILDPAVTHLRDLHKQDKMWKPAPQ